VDCLFGGSLGCDDNVWDAGLHAAVEPASRTAPDGCNNGVLREREVLLLLLLLLPL